MATDRKNIVKDFSDEQRNKGNEKKYKKLSMDMRNDLLERLDTLSKIFPRGFKTDAINKGLEIILDELEELHKEELAEYKSKNNPDSK